MLGFNAIGEYALSETGVATGAALAASVPISANLSLGHGVAAGITAGVPVTAEITAEFIEVNIEGDIAAVVPVIASVFTVHGVAAAAVAAVPITAGTSAGHGVAATGAAGVPITASVTALHERFELRGEVRDGGVLVNRRVRAYLRSTGALIAQADTVAGKFQVHAGFAAAECYITPIDLSDTATDWLPPTGNRITSVLAQDAA